MTGLFNVKDPNLRHKAPKVSQGPHLRMGGRVGTDPLPPCVLKKPLHPNKQRTSLFSQLWDSLVHVLYSFCGHCTTAQLQIWPAQRPPSTAIAGGIRLSQGTPAAKGSLKPSKIDPDGWRCGFFFSGENYKNFSEMHWKHTQFANFSSIFPNIVPEVFGQTQCLAKNLPPPP